MRQLRRQTEKKSHTHLFIIIKTHLNPDLHVVKCRSMIEITKMVYEFSVANGINELLLNEKLCITIRNDMSFLTYITVVIDLGRNLLFFLSKKFRHKLKRKKNYNMS